MTNSSHLTAFAGKRKVASGTLHSLAPALKDLVTADPHAQILIFDDQSGKQVDLNLHGSLADVLQRLPRPQAEMEKTAQVAAPRSVGRPKLGVVAREITLLPRHWEWLASQPGGASVALRKLVESAQRDNRAVDEQRGARDAAYHFISALAGDEAGYEEATRALFAGQRQQFEGQLHSWPVDVREHALLLAQRSWPAVSQVTPQ